jgi:Ca-activated chloride channel homolog
MPRTCVIVAAILVIGLSPLDGQTLVSGAQRAPFRGGVDVVGMNVTVTDGARHYVTDLDRQDFQIFEDGRPQQVTFFRRSSLPLALALLIDTSASMEPNLSVAQAAAVGFVRALGPEDVASVIDFDTRVQVLQEFTTDRSALEHAIRKTAAGGSTALYNAVDIALRALNKTIGDERLEERRRRAIVILSDGEDTSSLLGFDEVLDFAVRSDTAIYAIGLFGPEITAFVKRPSDARFVLRRLSEQTGGRVFFASDAKELNGVYSEIRAELGNQYFLAYESNDPRRDGQFRRISVRVSRASAVARSRPGYYAPSQ